MTTSRLTPPSRGLRQSGGLAENRVWARLRGGAVDGWKVRRQHPVGRFVVDFACVPLRLVIEIDGGVHELWRMEAATFARPKGTELLPSPPDPRLETLGPTSREFVLYSR